MRHIAVALWVRAGAPALQVARQAGHTEVAVTLDRYGHLDDDAEDALASGLEALAGSTSASPARDLGLRGGRYRT